MYATKEAEISVRTRRPWGLAGAYNRGFCRNSSSNLLLLTYTTPYQSGLLWMKRALLSLQARVQYVSRIEAL